MHLSRRIATALAPILTTLFLAHPPTWVQGQELLVKPYVQPGDPAAYHTPAGRDVKVLVWLTDNIPAPFQVRYSAPNQPPQTTLPVHSLIVCSNKSYLRYTALLTNLPLSTRIDYSVHSPKGTAREDNFTTRRPTHEPVHFIVVGDLADGRVPSRHIAWQMAQASPEFIVMVGDLVYGRGRLSEYFKNFFPIYNQPPFAGSSVGAPLMASVPIYAVLGNHDIAGLDLAAYPDGLAAFYLFHSPVNGPQTFRNWTLPDDIADKYKVSTTAGHGFTPVLGPQDRIQSFHAAAGRNHPGLCNYSFDNGPVHGLCLDANGYVNVDDPDLQAWIRHDLTQSTAPWKLVFFHQPGFQQSKEHKDEQRMRRLAPLFEECGVNLVLAGHVHNYQRSHPLRFQPDALTKSGTVPGTFTLDTAFDGKTQTRPKGIVYVVTGGGGASLSDKGFTNHPELWIRHQPGAPDFIQTLISDRHSFSVIDASPTTFQLRQVDEAGNTLDQFRITR